MVLPPKYVDTLLRRLDTLDKNGVRCPVLFLGAQVDFPSSLQEEIRKHQEAIKGEKSS